jgi:hypothetical protein
MEGQASGDLVGIQGGRSGLHQSICALVVVFDLEGRVVDQKIADLEHH